MPPPSTAPLSSQKTRDWRKTLSAHSCAPVAAAERSILSRVSASAMSRLFPLRVLVAGGVAAPATPAFGQPGVLTPRDSALVRRILLPEDHRDSASAAFVEGA